MPVKIANTREATSDQLNRRDYSKVAYDVSFEGAVIGTYERNGYHDSDFYAIVWDDEAGRITVREYATTRGWTYLNSAQVDITDENLAKAEAWAASEAFRILWDSAQRDAQSIQPGKTVRLKTDFKGRKQPSAKAGEELQVQAVYDDRYDYNRYTGKYGQKVKGWTADGREIALSVDKFEVVDPEQYLPEQEAVTEQARNWAARDKTHAFRGILEGWLHR